VPGAHPQRARGGLPAGAGPLRSIRRTLLAWLLLALAGGMALVMAATYAFAYAQITRVFDEEMVKVAQAAHLGED
jgi:hypothetical protein